MMSLFDCGLGRTSQSLAGLWATADLGRRLQMVSLTRSVGRTLCGARPCECQLRRFTVERLGAKANFGSPSI